MFMLIIVVNNNSSLLYSENINPVRPKKIHPNAKWDKGLKIWEYKDKKDGNYYTWYENGVKRTEFIKITNKIYKLINYHENGIVEETGQEMLFNDLFDVDEDKGVGWEAIGKWKKFDNLGHIIREVCLTPVYKYNRLWEVKECGKEIKYVSGIIVKVINHKLDCKYGCDEH